jgi:NADH dehydrogenase
MPILKEDAMLLIAGATGSLGNKIVRGLLERGDTVRILARPASNYAPLKSAGAEVALGDLKEPDTLDQACAGVDVVISTATASKRGDDSIENVDLQGNQNLITAAQRAGVKHFILVSTLGASADSPVPLFRAKAAAEQRLRNGSMVHTVLQANVFMDVWFPMLIEQPIRSARPITLVGESRRRHSFVTEQDVAAFAIAAVRNPAARNTTIAVGGPEPLTFRDVVRAYEEAAGRTYQVRSVAPGDPIPGLPDVVSGIAASLEAFDSMIPMAETARQYGVVLTNVRAFAKSRVEALAAR